MILNKYIRKAFDLINTIRLNIYFLNVMTSFSFIAIVRH